MVRRVSPTFTLPVAVAMSLVLGACGIDEQPAEAAADDAVVVQIGDARFDTIAAIYDRYDDAKGSPLALHAPVAPAEQLDGGMMQEYSAGTIYWSPETGAHIVRGQILDTYLDHGGPSGPLGWPVSDETVEGELVYSEFQKGRIRLKDMALQVVEYSAHADHP